MFQYKVCTRIDLQNSDDEATTQDWLNEQGRENWELVSCIPLGSSSTQNTPSMTGPKVGDFGYNSCCATSAQALR